MPQLVKVCGNDWVTSRETCAAKAQAGQQALPGSDSGPTQRAPPASPSAELLPTAAASHTYHERLSCCAISLDRHTDQERPTSRCRSRPPATTHTIHRQAHTSTYQAGPATAQNTQGAGQRRRHMPQARPVDDCCFSNPAVCGMCAQWLHVHGRKRAALHSEHAHLLGKMQARSRCTFQLSTAPHCCAGRLASVWAPPATAARPGSAAAAQPRCWQVQMLQRTETGTHNRTAPARWR